MQKLRFFLDRFGPRLKQPEPADGVRPAPPALDSARHARWAAALKAGDPCQLRYEDGWWDVLVIRKSGGEYVVKPLLYDIEHSVAADVLRPKVEWTWDVGSKQWRARGGGADANEGADDEA